MSEPYDPRRSVSPHLTEVRTVLSRAKSALAIIEETMQHDDKPWCQHPGDDLEMIKLALMAAISALEPWERHGSRAGRGGRSVR